MSSIAGSRMAGRTVAAILSIVAVGAVLSFGAGKTLAADDVTEDQIIKALAPSKKPLTRGLSAGPQTDPAASAAETKFVSTIRGRATRSLSITEREEIATLAKDKPNIDLEITFDYNSAEISQKSLASVQALGRALTNPDLKGSTFVVAGHTDAAGSDGYNQDLSERRADSIKRYLMDKYGIAAADLVTVGYGWFEHRSRPEEKETPGQALVVVTKSTNACFSDLVRVTGFVVPRREAVVGADQEGSKVTDLFVREGDMVTDNQELARLSAPPQQPGGQQRASQAPVSLRAPAASDHLTVQVVKGNTVETRKVRVGLVSDTNTEILEGLDVGETVVADAGSSLHDGDRIKTMFADEIDRRVR